MILCKSHLFSYILLRFNSNFCSYRNRKSDYDYEPTIPSLVLELQTRIPIRDGVTW